jgi:hypothetical protein
MESNLLRSKLENLTPAHQRAFLNILCFLLWAEQPFDQAIVVFIEAEYRHGKQPLAPVWLLKLRFLARILRGAWKVACVDGLTNTWLVIAGAYR